MTDAVQTLVAALAAGQVEVVDLTQPLSEETPILRLPDPFANTPRFRLRELSRYDERGPAWYWNAFEGGEHTGTHTPGVDVACARWLADERPILGIGVETVGTDAGAAHGFDPPFPCHSFLLGAGKYGLTQLANVDRLPATGALVIAAPLKIVGGSGSPTRVLALVPRA